MRKRRSLIVFIVILGVMLFGVFTVYSFVKEINKKQLPALGQVYNFELIDDKGENYSLSSLIGKIWIADFFFTTCSDICPVMSKNMAKLNRTFEGVKGVRLVSISVNPENDSAAVLEKYAKAYDARDNWVFLTGDRQVIKDLALKSFKLGSIDEPVFHSSYFSLVDQYGIIRGYYDGMDKEEVNQLYKDAAFLIRNNPS